MLLTYSSFPTKARPLRSAVENVTTEEFKGHTIDMGFKNIPQ